MNHRCAQNLRGEWKLLFEVANDDFESKNKWVQHHVKKINDSRRNEIALEQLGISITAELSIFPDLQALQPNSQQQL